LCSEINHNYSQQLKVEIKITGNICVLQY